MKDVTLKTFLFLLLTSLIFMNFQCNDCDGELHDRTNFIVSPNTTQNTFKVGDTLTLSTSFNSLIELEFSKITYDNSNQLIDYRLEIFEGKNEISNANQARDDFEFTNIIGNVSSPPARTWEIRIENICDDNLCELEFGMIPKKAGYFGIALRLGGFGYEEECQYLTLMPTGIETNGNNNFELFEELNLSGIRINNAYFKSPETERNLYFFKVVD